MRGFCVWRKESKNFSFILTQAGDALDLLTEEGRARAAIIVGELLRSYDPAVSEWGNPANFIIGHIHTKLRPSGLVLMRIVGTSRTETSK